jgi:hypothetical protein
MPEKKHPQAFRIVVDVIYRDESPHVDSTELGRYVDEELNLAGAPGIIKGHRIGVVTLKRVDAEELGAQCDEALERRERMN